MKKGRNEMTLLAKAKPDAYVIKHSEKVKLESDKTSAKRAKGIAEAAEKFEKTCIKSTDFSFVRK